MVSFSAGRFFRVGHIVIAIIIVVATIIGIAIAAGFDSTVVVAAVAVYNIVIITVGIVFRFAVVTQTGSLCGLGSSIFTRKIRCKLGGNQGVVLW